MYKRPDGVPHKQADYEVVHWMSSRQVAEERGDATGKEKMLLPILACHFKEDTRTLFRVLEVRAYQIDVTAL